MTQSANEHYTSEELSAYLDKELTVQEMTVCTAHLQTCAICRTFLTDLQLTSNLLHALPQEPVPHDFTLPLSTLQKPVSPPLQILEAPAQASTTRKPGPKISILRSTVRVLSTLAALVGLALLLSSLFAGFPGSSASPTSNTRIMSTDRTANQPATGNATGSHEATRTAQQTEAAPEATPTAQTAAVQATPTTEPTATAAPEFTRTFSGTSNPPLIDFTQPITRLLTGLGLLLLGLVGSVVLRKKAA